MIQFSFILYELRTILLIDFQITHFIIGTYLLSFLSNKKMNHVIFRENIY